MTEEAEAEYAHFAEHVKTSSMISVGEKETHMGFVGREDEAWIDSEHRGAMKNLLKNRFFEPESFSVEKGDETIVSVDPDEYNPEMGHICGVYGKISVGALTVKSTPRQTQTPSSVVNCNYESWDADEVYND